MSIKGGQVVARVIIHLGKKVNKVPALPKPRGLAQERIGHWLRLQGVGGMHGHTEEWNLQELQGLLGKVGEKAVLP